MWYRGGAFKERRIFQNRYDSGMDTENRELWDRLENEPTRVFHAFQSFLNLPSGDRTLLAAYRGHVGNPEAVKPSDTWAKWCSDFAWRERATAYDDHLASVRREAYERAVEEEAARQAREVEKVRGRYNELMTTAYVQAAEWLEDAQPSDLRAQDVIKIIGLHMDYLKAFDVEPDARSEDDWTEEDDAEFADIIKEIDELEDPDGFSDEDDAGED
jgi:hypothetical protein